MASKQETEVKQALNLIANDVKSQVDLAKVTNNPLHKGIIVDFWIPSINTIVEVHGIQHYQVSGFGASEDRALSTFNKQTNRDEKLKSTCEAKGINYIEVPYTEKGTTNLIKQILELMD